MSRFNDDFDGYAVAAGIPTGWADLYSAANTAVSIITDGSSPGGQAMQIVKSGSGRPVIKKTIADGSNQQALCLFEPGATSSFSLWIGASGTGASPTGTFVEVSESSNTIRLWRASSGSFNTLSAAAGFTVAAGTKYWLRICRFSDNDVRARIWASGDPEPTTWNCSGTTAAAATGAAGVSELATSVTTIVHRLSTGTDYDVGCSSNDDQFPTDGIYYTCTGDDSIRVMETDGSPDFVVSILHDLNNVEQVRWHRTKQKLYVTCSTSGKIIRMDRFGLNHEDIVTGLSNVFGITFDYANSLMYYTTRAASSNLYQDSDEGGSQSTIVSGITWAGHPWFREQDGFIYVPYDNAVRSYNSSGTLQTTYPTLTNAHTVVCDDTNVMAGAYSTAGLWYIPIASGSWTNADSTHELWNLDLSEDETTLYGAAFSDDVLAYWDGLPPPASANRNNIKTSIDQVHSVTVFSFSAAGSGGSGSGGAMGSGSGSGSGTEIENDYCGYPGVKKVKLHAEASQIDGTGTVQASQWLIGAEVLPAALIDSDEATAESAGAPGLRASWDEFGAEQIPICIDVFTPASGGYAGGAVANIWINPETADADNGKDVWLWWNRTGKTQPAVTAPYGKNAVFPDHYAAHNATDTPTGSVGDVPDSAGQHPGTTLGSMGALGSGPGSINKAWQFDGSDDEIEFEDFQVGVNVTWKGWLNADNITTRRAIFGKHDSGGGNEVVTLFWQTGQLTSILNSDVDTSGASALGWNHWIIEYVESGGNTTTNFIKNGTLVVSQAHTGTIGYSAGGKQWRWGQEFDGASRSDFWLGDMAALRMIDGVYSDAESIGVTETNNQGDNSTFWTTSAVQDGVCTPSGGSGSGGSGDGPYPIADCYNSIYRDGYNMFLLWQPRNGNVINVLGNRIINRGTPSAAASYFAGGGAEIISRNDVLALDVIRNADYEFVKSMVRQGCEFRAFGFAIGVSNQTWFIDSKAQLIPTRRGAGSMAGGALILESTNKRGSIFQSNNILEGFPWNASVSTDISTPAGSGSGGANGSGDSSDWRLKSAADDSYIGELWQVAEGDYVDAAGHYYGSSAVLEYTFPAQGAILNLVGKWTGSVQFYTYQGILISGQNKTYDVDKLVAIPDETWTVKWTVTYADEIPRATVDYFGGALAARYGQCIDCSDPDAVASEVAWSDQVPPIYAASADDGYLYTISEDWVETKTGLDLSAYLIIDMSLNQRTNEIYYLGTGGKVYKSNYDGTDFVEVFDTTYTDLQRIHIDNYNEYIVLSTHQIATFTYNIYIYNLAGTLIRTFESRYSSNSITQGASGVGKVGEPYIYTWDNAVLYRFKIQDGAAQQMQNYTGVSNLGGGALDDVANVMYRIIGSLVCRYDPVTVNNPSNPTNVYVGANPLYQNSAFCDWFTNRDDQNVWVWCDGGFLMSWTVSSPTFHLIRTSGQYDFLCTKHDFDTT